MDAGEACKQRCLSETGKRATDFVLENNDDRKYEVGKNIG
jgi:hypothetical protein